MAFNQLSSLNDIPPTGVWMFRYYGISFIIRFIIFNKRMPWYCTLYITMKLIHLNLHLHPTSLSFISNHSALQYNIHSHRIYHIISLKINADNHRCTQFTTINEQGFGFSENESFVTTTRTGDFSKDRKSLFTFPILS